MDYNFHRSKGKIFCRWFEGGVTNVRRAAFRALRRPHVCLHLTLS